MFERKMEKTMKSKLKRIWILSLLFMIAWISTAAAAETGKIDIYLEYKNVTLNVYKIGTYDEVQGTRKAVLNSEYAGSGMDIDRIWTNASEIHAVAEALETYVRANQITPYQRDLQVKASTEEAGKQGKATIDNLEDGIYLFFKSGGSSRVTITPFILTMPYYDKDAAAWQRSFKVYSKCGYDDGGGGNGGGDGGNGGGNGDNGSGNGGSENPSTTTIFSSDVPLASFQPDTQTIEDLPVPLAGLPKLGDMGAGGYLIAAFAAACAGLAAMGKGRKYRNRDEG